MKAFFRTIDPGDFSEFYITGDKNTPEKDSVVFEVDATEVYPEMVDKCYIDVTTKVTVNPDNVIFEDELLERIIGDIETEVKNIKDASNRIALEKAETWSKDHLAMIDSRVEIINGHIQKFRDVLDIIYNS